MAFNLNRIETLLADLEERLPALIKGTEGDESSLWPTLAGEFDYILDNAGPEHQGLVKERVSAMLAENGFAEQAEAVIVE